MGLMLSAATILRPSSMQSATVIVKNADGTPAENATVCIGSSTDRALYGTATTDHLGQAIMSVFLPTSQAFYVTANKGGHGAEQYIANTAEVPPTGPFFQIDLPATMTGPACGNQGYLDLDFQIEFNTDTILAGQILEIVIILDRPPPVPMPFKLESSNPRLLSLPSHVTFRKGEQRKTVRVRTTKGSTKKATSVDVRGGIGKDPKKKKSSSIRVTTDDDDEKDSRRKGN